MANPCIQGSRAVVMVAAATAVITQDPMTVIQTAVCTAAVVSTVSFFARNKPDNTSSDVTPEFKRGT